MTGHFLIKKNKMERGLALKNFNLNQTLFVFGIGHFTKPSELKEHLDKKLTGIKRIMMPSNRRSGFAFIEMSSISSAKKLQRLKNLKYRGKQLKIIPYSPGIDLTRFQSEGNLRRIFISKIPKNWENENLLEVFSGFEKLVTAYIIKPRQNDKPKGIGYAIFETAEAAAKAASICSKQMKERIPSTNEQKGGSGRRKEGDHPGVRALDRTQLEIIQGGVPLIELRQQWLKPTKSSYHLMVEKLRHRQSNVRINTEIQGLSL